MELQRLFHGECRIS